MRKLGLVFLVLVLALGALGVGYAKWSDTVVINGSISSGEVCLEWTGAYGSKDPCTPPTKDWTCDPGFTNICQGDKDIGCTTVVMEDEDTISVTLDSVYPCYFNEISSHIHNCGTIPVKIAPAILSYPDPANPGETIEVELEFGKIAYIAGDDQYGGISNVIEIKWLEPSGVQLHPCVEWELSWYIHILQPAKQGSQYTFTITIEGIQWNEYPPGDGG